MNRMRWLPALLCALALAGLPDAAAAQRRDTTTSRLPSDPRFQQRGLSQADIIERLRASGMTRSQVRAELQRRGYDPSLADPYFDILEREAGGAPTERRRADFASALEEMGLARDSTELDSLRVRTARDARLEPDVRRDPRLDPLARDSLASEEQWLDEEELELEALLGLTGEDRLQPGELPVFGRSFFSRAGGQMDIPAYGPVSAGYRVGPGDEINVVLTGAVQDAYALRVSREGTLVVPEAGELVVNGLTLPALEELLRARLSSAYAGVGTGRDALTRVGVSLGRVRMIQVYVVGDVIRPGAYEISSLSTVLAALYRAGGPAKTGSFREIEVRRGPELVRRFDLYDYLLHGNSHADLRLDQGDVVFVPPVARRVELDGAIKRPGIYELLPGDSLRDAIRFAGGAQAQASLRRIQIDRVLPPAQRRPGVERVLVDVDVLALLAPGAPDVAIADGDRVRLFDVPDERRNLITVLGEVRRPGAYAWSEGTTLADVLDRASGVTDRAYTDRIHVYRLDVPTGVRKLVSASLALNGEGRPVQDLTLEDRDSVVVYSRDWLRTREYVTIGGRVKRPGRYPLPEGATVKDAILAAGGFTEGAYQLEAYVARPNLSAQRGDTTAVTIRVPLASSATAAAVSSAPPSWSPGEGEFELRHGDRIEIRRAPGYEDPRTVMVTGEVALPGGYVLETREDRVSGLLRASGGLTKEAYLAGAQVVRDGDVVSTDVARALERPGTAADLLLQDGDSIHVPRYDPTVLVTGAVVYRTRVAYRPGMSLEDYIREAGGYAGNAYRNRTTVTYANGTRNTVRVRALLPDGQPQPEPGSVIFVPERPAGMREGTNWATVISTVAGMAGAIATLIIATNQK